MASLRRAPIVAITLNVALIHAAGLVLLNQARPELARVGGSTSRPQVVHMRLAQAKPAPAAPTTAAVPSPSDAVPDEASVPPGSDAEVSTAADTILPDAAPPDTGQPEPFQVDQVLAGLDLGAAPDARASGNDYFPRPQLSTVPKPSAPVIVPFPKEITSPGRYTATLALFIDETGVVRRVRIDGPSLPKPMEEAARDSFLQAHFSPGEIDGQRVKSLIRIEVVFDNTPIASAENPRSL